MPRTARAWQRMLSGRRLDLLDPTPMDIEVEDIAHGLAFVARWNGQTQGDYAYSVAEHSLLVETIYTRLTPELRILPMASHLLPGGTGRPKAITPIPSLNIRFWWKRFMPGSPRAPR